jgi:hypothetical protein
VTEGDRDLDAVLAEIQSTVERNTASGVYSESLEDELRSHFARILDRTGQDRYGAVWAAVDDLEALRSLPSSPRHTASRVPGGEIVHKTAGRVFDRQLAPANDRNDLMWRATVLALRSIAEILDEPVNHTHDDLLHEIDTLQDRVAELERRLAHAQAQLGDVRNGAGVVQEAR